MTYADQDFWSRIKAGAPGLLDMGVNAIGNRGARREAQNELNIAEGPDYQAPMGAARTALSRAGSLDPRASGAEWLRDQRGLLAPGDAADEAELLRRLNNTGMLGASSYGVQGPGAANVAQNPMAAAFYAQRANRDQRMAAEALDRGEASIDRQLGRSGRLQSQAQNSRAGTLNARGTLPSKAASTAEMLRGGMNILKETGLLGAGVDWLRGLGGGGFNTRWFDTASPSWGMDFYG